MAIVLTEQEFEAILSNVSAASTSRTRVSGFLRPTSISTGL